MADIQKKYLYLIYKSTTFLGVLQNVTSEFSYSQDINSNAVSLSVEVALSADVADNTIDAIRDEAGNPLLDEAGQIIYEERALDVVGSFNPLAQIQENNIVKVYEISTDNPNGKIVFDGWIEDWNAIMGSDNDKITFIAISRGVDLQDYLVEGSSQLDQSQTVGAKSRAVYDSSSFGGWEKLGQTFQVGASASNVSAVLFKLAAGTSTPVTARVRLWNSYSDYFSGTPLATATQLISSTTAAEYTFTFPSVVAATAGQNFFVSIDSPDGTDTKWLYVYYTDSNVYANGQGMESNYSGGSGGGSWQAFFDGINVTDLYFKTYYSGGATSSPFNSQDPTAMLQTIIDSYVSAGGVANYGSGTIDASGVTASYTFKVNTVLEAIQKVRDLAGADFYWYVDPATLVLYMKRTATTPAHKFIKGRHLEQVQIGGTVEHVRNILYFSGGDIGGGVNLFTKYTNTSSLNTQGRRRLDRISDNRVTLQATADLIASNFLSQNRGVAYSSPVVINGSSYDISTIHVGDVIAFEGFGNFADYITVQVARLTRHPDSVELVLGIVLQRASDALTQALNDLDKLQTVANPSAPS